MSIQWAKVYGPALTSYPSLLRHLYNINNLIATSGIPAPNARSKINTLKLYEAIGRPLDAIPSILVGGTNGKGTTSLKLATGLKASGFRTGLFVSPHISSYRERVQINDTLIEEHEVMALISRVLDICLRDEIPATFFEITFAMACLQFQSKDCDAVVLEVGVGGEWDATNVVSAVLSIICSVDLDHVRFLGPTIKDIAINKAGIFKTNRPSLIGPGCPCDVLEIEAWKRKSNLFKLDRALAVLNQIEVERVIETSVDEALVDKSNIVNTDALNAKLALAGLALLKGTAVGVINNQVDPSASSTPYSLYSRFSKLLLASDQLLSALTVTAPCRWQKLSVPVALTSEDKSVVASVEVVLDLGHNPAAIAALARRIRAEYPTERIRVLYGMSRDKSVRECLVSILRAIDPKDLYFIQSGNFRALSIEEMRTFFSEVSGGQELTTLNTTDISGVVPEVLQLCASSNFDATDTSRRNVLLICGSAYFMPQVRALLGINEPRDELDLAREE